MTVSFTVIQSWSLSDVVGAANDLSSMRVSVWLAKTYPSDGHHDQGAAYRVHRAHRLQLVKVWG